MAIPRASSSPELRLELLDRWEAPLQLGGQLLEKPVGRHADGLLHVAQRARDDDLFFSLPRNDGWLIPDVLCAQTEPLIPPGKPHPLGVTTRACPIGTR